MRHSLRRHPRSGDGRMEVEGTDRPNYRTLTYRSSFLVCLFLLVCGLLVALEFMLRTIPVETGRTTIPQELYPIGADHSFTRQPRRAFVPRATDTNVPDDLKVRDSQAASPEPTPSPRPPDQSYASLGMVTTRFTWADSWNDDPSQQGNRIPAAPQEEKDAPCAYYYKGLVTTSNTSACEGVITFDPKRFTQHQSNIIFPDTPEYRQRFYVVQFSSPECSTSYENWFLNSTGCDRLANLGCGRRSPARAAFCRPRDLPEDEQQKAMDNLDPPSTITWDPTGRPNFYKEDEHMEWARVIFERHKDLALVYFDLTYYLFVGQEWRDYSSETFYNAYVGVMPPLPTAARAPDTGIGSTSGPTATSAQDPDVTGTSAARSEVSTIPQGSQTLPYTIVEITQTFKTTEQTPTASVVAWTSFSTGSDGSQVAVSTVTTTHTATLERETRVLSSGVAIAVIPAVWKPASATTLRNSAGQPTATSTDYGGEPVLTPTKTTLRDGQGKATATVLTDVPIATSVVTFADSDGVPTATLTEHPVFPYVPDPHSSTPIHLAGSREYFVIFFLPVILSVLLLVPIKLLDADIKLHLPLRGLTRAGGSSARDSLCMPTGGFGARKQGLRLLWQRRDPVSAAGDMLVVCSTVLVSLSSETVGVKLRGVCVQGDFHGCLMTVATFAGPARAAEALLVAILVLVTVAAVSIIRWRTGVATHPGSVAAVCVLLQNPETRSRLRRSITRRHLNGSTSGDEQLAEDLHNKKFALGWDSAGPRADEYGIMVLHDGDHDADVPSEMESTTDLVRPSARPVQPPPTKKRFSHLPSSETILRAGFLLIHLGLLALILYYELTVVPDPRSSPFEMFMDSQAFGAAPVFGVRFLFTSLGSLIAFFWERLFSDVSTQNLYRRMADRPQPAATSVLQVQSTNIFEGLWRAVRLRDPDVGAVALGAVLVKFAPVLLSSIPFQMAQTFVTHEICTWLSVAILGYGAVVLARHTVFPRRLHLPVDPQTLAGRIYYVYDSVMLRDFQRLSMLGRKQRDERVARMGRTYRFRSTAGASGETGVGIDYAEGEQGIMMKRLTGLGRTGR